MSAPWSVEDLTPDELAELQAVLVETEEGLPCCQDGDEAGLGDEHHGIDQV